MTALLPMEDEIVAALRRIIRGVDLHSSRLVQAVGLTWPQLATLRAAERAGCCVISALARDLHLGQATVTGIIQRLEKAGYVERTRHQRDGRSVTVTVTPQGREVLKSAPSLLQDRFRREFSKLKNWERFQTLASLHRIAEMMDIESADASPFLMAQAVGAEASTGRALVASNGPKKAASSVEVAATWPVGEREAGSRPEHSSSADVRPKDGTKGDSVSAPTVANGKLEVALPEPSMSMSQDAEWCVVRVDDEWRQIRFHDYSGLYSIPGLYERVIYDILRCDSPHTIRSLLERELLATGTPPNHLRVLDLGAGNGMVGEELASMDAAAIVGVDIIEEAAMAAERDRPGLYEAYYILDMTNLSADRRRQLATHRFNALTCVAALGFSDIPPRAFAAAYNLVATGGWIAFNIKEDFLAEKDRSGFAGLIRAMVDDGALELRQRRRYQHRLATSGRPLHYMAIVGIKNRDVPEEMLS